MVVGISPPTVRRHHAHWTLHAPLCFASEAQISVLILASAQQTFGPAAGSVSIFSGSRFRLHVTLIRGVVRQLELCQFDVGRSLAIRCGTFNGDMWTYWGAQFNCGPNHRCVAVA